ncbi:MAG TPA: ATP-binding protein [Candidatus Limnocylindrales bacterium]|nr:ATP-binding protein [Candidatus Limnocylindrales bacterium]
MRAASALILTGALCFTVSTAAARKLPVRVFTSAQGLPRNSVNCIVPGPSGVLWLCTSEGLARFDGYRFRLFGPESGLPSRHIVGLARSRNGGFWLSTDSEICRLTLDSKVGQPCKPLEISPPLKDTGTFSVIETAAGETWISTTQEVLHVSADGKRLERTNFKPPKEHSIQMIMEGREGSLLVCTDFAILEFHPGGTAHSITESAGPMGVFGYVDLGGGRRLLASSGHPTILEETPGGYKLHQFPLPGLNYPRKVLRRRDGSIWAAGIGGIAHLNVTPDNRVTVAEFLGVREGLPTTELSDIEEDSQGNLWASTEGAGIFRIADSGFVTYDESDGLLSTRINSIFEDPAGGLYVEPSLGPKPFVMKVVNGGFQPVYFKMPAHPITYMGWGWNQHIVAARNGDWWLPTGDGILRYRSVARPEFLATTEPVRYGFDSDLKCHDVFRAFEDSRGDIWVSCIEPRGLARWDHVTGRFHRFEQSEGWSGESLVTAMREAPDGAVWIGTTGEVARLKNGRFAVHPVSDKALGMRDMLIDRAGRMWVATWRDGVFRCDNITGDRLEFRHYGLAEGLSATMGSLLAEDAAGYIYAGTARGIDRIDPAAPVGRAPIRHFTTADGLPDSEPNTAHRDRRGHIWFGTLRGLSEFDPEHAPRSAPWPVYITRVRVRGEDVPVPWEGARHLSLDLASNRNQVEIEYAAVDLRSVESLRYQYRLNGVDRDWSEPRDSLTVNYASLPSGRFLFEVRAVNPDGQVSLEPARFDLFVETPLWRRWWFLTLAAAVLAGAVKSLYEYRVRHLLAMERLRTRIATDLHDDIGASLTQISILSEVARRKSEPRLLNDIAETARGLVQDMSDIVWEVNPRHDRFDALVHRMRRFAGDTLAGADIELKFESEGLSADFTVPMEARRPLYLVFKEAVNNVARHSGATAAVVRLERDGGALRLTVIDNGHGFDAHRKYEGEGLTSMARRMRELGGAAEWDARPGQGSRFTATLPLKTRGLARRKSVGTL